MLHFPKTSGRTDHWILPHPLYHHFHALNSVHIEDIEDNGIVREVESRFDGQGFKDLPKNNDWPKILFIGDSFVQANQVGVDESFGNLLEKKLNNIDIVNFGCSSWSSILYYNWLKNNLSKLKGVKSVYVFYFSNDPYDTASYFNDADDPQKTDDITFNAYAAREGKKISAVKNWLYKNVRLYYLASNVKDNWLKMKKTRLRREIDDKDWESIFAGVKTSYQKKAMDLEKMYLTKINDFLKKNSVQFCLVYIPAAQQVARNENSVGSAFYSREFLDVMYHSSVLQDQLRVLAEKNGFPFIDLTGSLREFKRSEPETLLYLKSDGHFSLQGHRVVADILLKEMKGRAGSLN